MIGTDSDLGYSDGPDGARVGAGLHGLAGWCWLVGPVVGGSGGVRGLAGAPRRRPGRGPWSVPDFIDTDLDCQIG